MVRNNNGEEERQGVGSPGTKKDEQQEWNFV
jgi:hypothetical protein